MAFYKEPCIHCGTFLPRDAHFCTKCGSRSPFLYACPTCLREIHREDALCSGCGKALHVVCPHCFEKTFVQDNCEHCGGSLMVLCPNKRCGSMQFFENIKCTSCGKKIK